MKLVTNYTLSHNYLNVCKQVTDVKLLLLYSNAWNHFIVCEQMINI